jgi:hypothetical protein
MGQHLITRQKTHVLKNLDKGSEKWTVYLLTDIKLEKFNELRHMECSRHPRKNGGNNVRVRKTKSGCIGLTETERKGTGTEIIMDRRAVRGVSILIKKKFKKRNNELGSSE